MGNPHGFVGKRLMKTQINQIFEMINATKAFSNDVNIEFCKRKQKALSMRVLRGSGRD